MHDAPNPGPATPRSTSNGSVLIGGRAAAVFPHHRRAKRRGRQRQAVDAKRGRQAAGAWRWAVALLRRNELGLAVVALQAALPGARRAQNAKGVGFFASLGS